MSTELHEAKARVQEALALVEQSRAENDRIRQALEHLNTQKIEVCPIRRIRRHIETLRKNMAKLQADISVNGETRTVVAPPVAMPGFIREATASYKGASVPMSVEVRLW